MPFRWTINPYRGCTHACTYCGWGETPVLMWDGRTKRLADLQIGDQVYGTVRRGRYRRYSVTEVRDHWSTIKPAYRVTLEDGTELIASGDHRFLTRRGWKHVTGAYGGPLQRPHLTLNDKLIGTGGFPESPEDAPDYRRGYLCGLIRGDGHLFYGPTDARDDRRRSHHRFRLALTDREALNRAKLYLEEERGVITHEFAFPTLGRRSMRAIRTQSHDNVAAITELIQWPRGRRTEWCKGFLAGIFDAEGSHSGCLRISNTDHEIIDWIAWSLTTLDFRFVIEDLHRPNGLRCVRLLGGLPAILRFFITIDPAITRKRNIEGVALKSSAKLKVESIEPLGKGFRLYDITTGTGDFIANGVVSHNCFARPTHTYLDFNAGRDFEREIVVKVNTPEVARAELMRPSWKREHVALGTNTDPYQWVEKKYELLPGVWEAMRDSRTPCSVLTKSPLLLRDIELFKQIPALPRTCRSPLSTRRPGAPASRTRRTRASASRPSPSSTGRHPDRRADRPADARHQRLARTGRGDPRAVRRGGRRLDRRHLPAPARRGARRLHGLAALLPARPRAALRDALRPRRLRAADRARSPVAAGALGIGRRDAGHGFGAMPEDAEPKWPRRRRSSRRCSECQRQTAATRGSSSNAPLFIYDMDKGRSRGRALSLPFSAAERLEQRTAARRQPVANQQALRQAELLQLAHVALEGQLFAADEAARSSARSSGLAAISSKRRRVHGPCRLAGRSARAARAVAPARRRQGLPARAGAPRVLAGPVQLDAPDLALAAGVHSPNSSSSKACPARAASADRGAIRRLDQSIAAPPPACAAARRPGRADEPSAGRRA